MKWNWLKPGLQSTALLVGIFGASSHAQITKEMTVLSSFLHPGTVLACSGIWGWTSPVTHKEYALMSVESPGGLSIVDLSAPSQPKEVVFIPGVVSNWQEIASYKNYVYKIHQLGTIGLQIINMTPLNTGGQPTLVANSTKFFTNAHTLYVDSTTARLYITYGSTAGVVILSLANPADPVEIARIAGESHDMFALGNRLYISTQNRGTVEIRDLTTVTSSKLLGVIDLKAINSTLGEPSPMAHSSWPTADGKVLFTAEETTGGYTKSWNIEDPAKPVYLGRFKAKATVISHNVYVHGKYLYVAHNNLGLRIWNIDNPAQMKEEAFHSPSTSTEEFGGTWGAYPFFPSGLLIHGDRDLGLFVVEPSARLKQVGPVPALDPVDRERFSISGFSGGNLHFRLPRAGGYVLSILTPAGREILSRRDRGIAGGQTLALDRGGLAAGNYLARLRQDDAVISVPIALNR